MRRKKKKDKRTIVLDFTNITDKEALHEMLMKSFGFPDMYGRNWDAFWDGISGLVQAPDKLVLANWECMVSNLPNDADILTEILERYNEENSEHPIVIEYRNMQDV